MQDKNEFIARELMPIAGDFADDYDWEAIADEAGEFDAADGWRLRMDIADTIETDGYSDELNTIMALHNASTAITCELVEEGEPQSLYKVSFTLTDEHGDDPYTLSVLAGNGDDPYTTTDWQGEQPGSIDECPLYNWVRCSDWLTHDGTGDDAKAIVRVIISELGEA